MRKDEYLGILSDRLKVLPIEEQRDIMEYYNEYFEDAGVENEETVIQELGDVEELAKSIVRENLGEAAANQMTGAGLPEMNNQPYNSQNGTYTQMNVPFNQNDQSFVKADGQSYNSYQEPKQGLSTGWKAVIAILTFPIWIGVVCTVLGVVFGFGVAAVACFVAGIAVIITGFSMVISSSAICLVLLGVGFLVMALALIFLLVSVGLAHLVVKIFKAIFGKKKQSVYVG